MQCRFLSAADELRRQEDMPTHHTHDHDTSMERIMMAQRFATDGDAYRTMRAFPMNKRRVGPEPGERTSDRPHVALTHP